MIPDFDQILDGVATDQQPDFRSDIEKIASTLSLYQDNQDLGFGERIAEELINIVGAWVTLKIRTDNEGYDPVWNEDVDPTYHNGLRLKAYFKPEPLASELTRWGLDTPNQLILTFARAPLYKILGDRMLRAGDLIDVPYGSASFLSPKQFRVLNSYDTGNFRYRWLYTACQCESILNDTTVKPNHD